MNAWHVERNALLVGGHLLDDGRDLHSDRGLVRRRFGRVPARPPDEDLVLGEELRMLLVLRAAVVVQDRVEHVLLREGRGAGLQHALAAGVLDDEHHREVQVEGQAVRVVPEAEAGGDALRR